MSPKILGVDLKEVFRLCYDKTAHLTFRGRNELTFCCSADESFERSRRDCTERARRGSKRWADEDRCGTHGPLISELNAEVRASASCLPDPQVSVVILETQVGNQIFAPEVTQSVLQFHQLDKYVVFGIKAGGGHR